MTVTVSIARVPLVAVLAFVASALVQEEPGAKLVVTITGLSPSTGTVRCALFDSEEGYLESAVRSATLEVREDHDRVVWSLRSLPAGRYAFVVHHDVNDNGRNDRNWLGIPSEPSVFSRETRARFGPPSWERASFVLESRDLEVTVEVR